MTRLTLVTLILLGAEARAEDWEYHKTNLQKLSTEIEMREKELKDLIIKKNHAHDRSHNQEVLKEIEEKHKQGEKSLAEYNKEVEHVRYRHPGREAEQETRSYSILAPRTVEDIEADIGIDGKLDKLKQKMKKQYGNFSPEKAVEKSDEDKKIPEKTETQRIIIKK